MGVLGATNEYMEVSNHASRVTTRFPVDADLNAGVVKRLSDMITR